MLHSFSVVCKIAFPSKIIHLYYLFSTDTYKKYMEEFKKKMEKGRYEDE